MAAAAPAILGSKLLIPAVGAVVGANVAKNKGGSPLQGALMGGLGGAGLQGAIAGIPKLLAAGQAAAPALAGSSSMAALGATPEAMAAQGVAMEAMAGGVNPAVAAKMAGLPPQATMALADPVGAGLIAQPIQSGGGLLGGIGKKEAVMAGGNMMLKGMQPNQPMPQPMPMPVQQRQQTRSMMSLANRPNVPGRGGFYYG